MPTKIYSGPSSIKTIGQLELTRVLIICDPFMEKSGKVNLITDILTERNVPFCIFSEVVPDPTIDVVTKGVALAETCSPDTVIALGGGSAMDTAKAVCHIYCSMRKIDKPQVIAIPTTSGTGSEVTSFAVISDPATKTKYPLVADCLVPDIAILDAELTASVPAKITADTGMDVLTHGIEAYVSTAATDFTDACSEKSLKMVWKYLLKVEKNGDDMLGREKMHNASCLAGIAFSEASLGICHSLAHALGGQFHISHGRANAMLLPLVITYNAGLEEKDDNYTALPRYVEIAKMFGLQSGTPKATVFSFISHIRRLMKQMDIPSYVTDLGVDPAEFNAAIPVMAEKAMADKCTITNPRKPTQQELEELYRELCKGGY